MTQPPLFSLAIIAAVTLAVYVIPVQAGVRVGDDGNYTAHNAVVKVPEATSPTIALYHPDNERERAQVIADIYDIK